MKTDVTTGSTIIIGLGNPILLDDGIGCALADFIADRISANSGITVLSTSLSPIRLMDEIAGNDNLIIIDSITTGTCNPGTLHVLNAQVEDRHPVSVHHFTFEGMNRIGAALGLRMPNKVNIYGIEILRPEEYGSGLSPALRDRIPQMANEILSMEFPDLNENDSFFVSKGDESI